MYTTHKKEPEAIYKTYEEEILKSLTKLRNINPNFEDGIKKRNILFSEIVKVYLPRRVKNLIRRFI